MGIEHRVNDVDGGRVCPKCRHISHCKAGGDEVCYGLYDGFTGEYYYCQNPLCDVERIYGETAVMVSGK